MQVKLKKITGIWADGWALDKHMIKSTFLGHDEYGHARFDNLRTEVGEATYQLKYGQQWSAVAPLAQALVEHIGPKLPHIGLIIPMPASKARERQPVTEVAREVGRLTSTPVFENLLLKSSTGQSLKDLNTREEKLEAIGDSLGVNDVIAGDSRWNVLLIDDLYHSGASMHAACVALGRYRKIENIYVAALTWR